MGDRKVDPDSGIMLELCELLKINVNELLSGERIMVESYDKRAEENLLEMRRQVEEKNKQLLRTEYLISFPTLIAGLFMCFVASLVDMPVWARITLIAFALVMIFTIAFIAVGIEQKAGYGLQSADQINKAILVTTGHVTRGARRFVEKQNTMMSVIDVDEIHDLIQKSARKYRGY